MREQNTEYDPKFEVWGVKIKEKHPEFDAIMNNVQDPHSLMGSFNCTVREEPPSVTFPFASLKEVQKD